MDPKLPRAFARRLRGEPLADRAMLVLSKVKKTSEILPRLREEFIDRPDLDIEIENGVVDLSFPRTAHYRFAADYERDGWARWQSIL